MKNLIDEAKEIIEMSLSNKPGNEAYTRRANDWLEKVKSGRQSGGNHHFEKGISCATCGNDLVCPSCEEG